MGSQSCRQQQYALDLADKSRRQSAPRAHNLIEVSPQTILDAEPNAWHHNVGYSKPMYTGIIILTPEQDLVEALHQSLTNCIMAACLYI